MFAGVDASDTTVARDTSTHSYAWWWPGSTWPDEFGEIGYIGAPAFEGQLEVYADRVILPDGTARRMTADVRAHVARGGDGGTIFTIAEPGEWRFAHHLPRLLNHNEMQFAQAHELARRVNEYAAKLAKERRADS